MDRPVAAIVGLTAVGKTEVAIEISKNIGAEIISADAYQVYKYFDIGTAKPTKKQRACITHHLIDIVDPKERYTVFKFIQDAKSAIKDIQTKGKIPIIVGGTAYYVYSLMHGLSPMPPVEPELELWLSTYKKKYGVDKLVQWLKILDNDSYIRIHHNDSQRVIRALAVTLSSGKKFS